MNCASTSIERITIKEHNHNTNKMMAFDNYTSGDGSNLGRSNGYDDCGQCGDLGDCGDCEDRAATHTTPLQRTSYWDDCGN